MHDTPSAPSINTDQRGSYAATVVANEFICREHFRLSLRVTDFPASVPGQFVQLQCSDSAQIVDGPAFEWQPGDLIPALGDALASSAMLNRPFSLAGRRETANGSILEIIYRVVGVGTDWLSRLKAESTLRVIGPIGKGFSPPMDRQALLVGGGVGIPPMLFAAQLFGRPAVAVCGATSRDLLPLKVTAEPDVRGVEATMCIDEFSRANVRSIITSDDGSIGRRGFVTDALRAWLTLHADTPSLIYTCGPEPMLKAVAQIAAEFNTPCQIAVERAMACGLGTCQSCVIRVRDGQSWKYKLACTDGPVFDATTLLW